MRGQGVWFADIEGGWNAAHEDLPGDRITHVGGTPIDDPSWRAHGTAVLGEVVGRDNGKGVVGIAPDVERVFTSSIGGTTVADALDAAAEALRAGDVLLIELQGGGPRGRYLPVEYWDDNFDAIQARDRRGVVVIEAAGNGAENLDHKAYKRQVRSRATRDSGAIMVGAGGPPRDGFVDRERLDFSNYGARVDVQGWGRKVATLDYGDLQRCDDDAARSPLHRRVLRHVERVADRRGRGGARRELRSRPRHVARRPRVRDLLRGTGTPQTGDTRARIGPRPDLARALATCARIGASMRTPGALVEIDASYQRAPLQNRSAIAPEPQRSADVVRRRGVLLAEVAPTGVRGPCSARESSSDHLERAVRARVIASVPSREPCA